MPVNKGEHILKFKKLDKIPDDFLIGTKNKFSGLLAQLEKDKVAEIKVVLYEIPIKHYYDKTTLMKLLRNRFGLYYDCIHNTTKTRLIVRKNPFRKNPYWTEEKDVKK